MKTLLCTAAAVTAFGFGATVTNAATITINLQGGALYQQDGSDLPIGSTTALLADNDGDGFGDVNFDEALVNTLEPAGTTLLMSQGTNNVLTTGGFTGDPVPSISREKSAIPSDNLVDGNQLAFLWFDKAYDANQVANGVGYSVDYGITTQGVNSVGTSIFTVPSDGAAVDRWFLVEPAGQADFSASAGEANQTTAPIPEPSMLALLGLGGVAMLGGRRRRTA